MRGDASTTLMSVLREGFQIENTRVHHRIYVCDPAKVRQQPKQCKQAGKSTASPHPPRTHAHTMYEMHRCPV